MRFNKHKNKIFYKKVFVVESIHNSKDSLKKVQITDKTFWVRLFNRVFGFIFMFFETNFVFMLFALMLFGT